MTREEAIERIRQNKAAAEFYAQLVGNSKSADNELKDIEAFNMAIKALSEPKTGEWIRISNDWIDGTCGARYFPIRCSVCGYSTYDDDATKFCPNCGSRMESEDK